MKNLMFKKSISILSAFATVSAMFLTPVFAEPTIIKTFDMEDANNLGIAGDYSIATKAEYVRTSAEKFAGNASLKLTASDPAKKYYVGLGWHTLEAGAAYKVTAKVKANSGKGIFGGTEHNAFSLYTLQVVRGVTGFNGAGDDVPLFEAIEGESLTANKDENGWSEISSILYSQAPVGDQGLTFQFMCDTAGEIVYIDDITIEKIDFGYMDSVERFSIPDAGETDNNPLGFVIGAGGEAFPNDATEFEAVVRDISYWNYKANPIEITHELTDEDGNECVYPGVSIIGNRLNLTDEAYAMEIYVMTKIDGRYITDVPRKITLVNNTGSDLPQIRKLALNGSLEDREILTVDYSWYHPDGKTESEYNVNIDWYGRLVSDEEWTSINALKATDDDENEFTIPDGFTETYSGIKAYISVKNKLAGTGEEPLVEKETNEAVEPAAPTASNVKIIGEIWAGGTAEIHFDYDDANGDEQGTHNYAWYIAEDETGNGISSGPVATTQTYRIDESFEGSYIGVRVQPMSVNGPGVWTPEGELKWYYIDSTNLWGNPGMEDTSKQDYQKVYETGNAIFAYDEDIVHSGDNSLHITNSENVSVMASGYIDASAGEFIKLSGWVYLPENGTVKGGSEYQTAKPLIEVNDSFQLKNDRFGESISVKAGEWTNFKTLMYFTGGSENKTSDRFLAWPSTGNAYFDDMAIVKVVPTISTEKIPSGIDIPKFGETHPETLNIEYIIEGKSVKGLDSVVDITYELTDVNGDACEYKGVSVSGNTLSLTDEAFARTIYIMPKVNGKRLIDTPIDILLVNNTGSGKPQARSAWLTGDIEVNSKLEAGCTYYDPNGISEDETKRSYEWYARTKDTDWTLISGEGAPIDFKGQSEIDYADEANELTISQAFIDEGYDEVEVRIIVKNIAGDTDENKSEMARTNPAAVATEPVAENVKVEGKHFVGEEITASYTYYDRNIFDEEEGSTYQWFRVSPEDKDDESKYEWIGEPTECSDEDVLKYRIVEADVKMLIGVKVIPRNSAVKGDEGDAQKVFFEGPVAPTVTKAEILGIAKVGNILTVKYDYNHKYGALENKGVNGTLITWYNNGAPVGNGNSLVVTSGMTSITVTVQIKSAERPYDGNSVTSNAVAVTSGGGTGGGGGVSSGFGFSSGSNKTETPKQEIPTASKGFSDIQNHWAKSYIEKLVEMGIVSGVNENEFQPDRFITRAEFCTLICSAFTMTDYDNEPIYTDVLPGDWFFESVQAASKAGVVNGFDGQFNPNAAISRQEMAKMIMSVVEMKYGEPATTTTPTFSDMSDVAEWAVDAISYLAGIGVLNGSDGKVNPTASATRAEAVVILAKTLELLGR